MATMPLFADDVRPIATSLAQIANRFFGAINAMTTPNPKSFGRRNLPQQAAGEASSSPSRKSSLAIGLVSIGAIGLAGATFASLGGSGSGQTCAPDAGGQQRCAGSSGGGSRSLFFLLPGLGKQPTAAPAPAAQAPAAHAPVAPGLRGSVAPATGGATGFGATGALHAGAAS